MDKGFESVGELLLPNRKLDLSGSMYVKCDFEVYDGDPLKDAAAKLIQKIEGPAKSFMRNWARFIREMFFVPNQIAAQVIDDGGIARALPVQGDISGGGDGVTAAAADFSFGDSNVAVDSTHFNLQGLILGPTPGVTPTLLQEDNAGRVFKVEASILNGGGAFTVREVGLFAHLREQQIATQNRRTMLMRDVLGVAVPVANGQTALGRYTFTALL